MSSENTQKKDIKKKIFKREGFDESIKREKKEMKIIIVISLNMKTNWKEFKCVR